MPNKVRFSSWHTESHNAFTLAEILFAVAIISVSFIGVSALISLGGRQATRIEDEREISDLALSVETCVKSFGIPYLRSIPSGKKTPVNFGSGNTQCATGAVFTGNYDPSTAAQIVLKGFTGSGTGPSAESSSREYGAYFVTSTGGLGPNSVKSTLTVTNGTVTKSLDFRMDSK